MEVTVNTQSALQVDENTALLKKMMKDMNRSPELYRPTDYWAHYEKYFLPELSKKGLRDFRRRKWSILSSFGAVDLKLSGEIIATKPFKGHRRISKVLNKLFEHSPFFKLGVTTDPLWSSNSENSEITDYFYHHVKEKFDKIGWDLNKSPTSLFGNPEDIVQIGGKYWSTQHLIYCSMVADAAGFINFGRNMLVCEIGSGMGRNIEVIANLFDDATCLLFDIPPQLYVCNQYLTKVFGSRVIAYEQAINIDPNRSKEESAKTIKGKILILPTWRLPNWSSLEIDIFWNSASFQEMEPNVVANYLAIVKKMSPKWIYINALPKGSRGTKEAVTSHQYVDELKDMYTLFKTYPTDYFLRKKEYSSFIFKKIS